VRCALVLGVVEAVKLGGVATKLCDLPCFSDIPV